MFPFFMSRYIQNIKCFSKEIDLIDLKKNKWIQKEWRDAHTTNETFFIIKRHFINLFSNLSYIATIAIDNYTIDRFI